MKPCSRLGRAAASLEGKNNACLAAKPGKVECIGGQGCGDTGGAGRFASSLAASCGR